MFMLPVKIDDQFSQLLSELRGRSLVNKDPVGPFLDIFF